MLLCSHLSKTYSQVLSSDGWFIVKINHRAMHPLGPESPIQDVTTPPLCGHSENPL